MTLPKRSKYLRDSKRKSISMKEIDCLCLLEDSIREMFAFSGWDEGVDEDAIEAVRGVSKAIDLLDAFRESQKKIHAKKLAAAQRKAEFHASQIDFVSDENKHFAAAAGEQI